jgi:hypothetical protein
MRDDPTRQLFWPIFLFCAAFGAALLAAGLAASEQQSADGKRLLGPLVADLKPFLTAK